jgi:hypothetical protein
MALPHELERLPRMQKVSERIYFSDCSPAEGTIAAFDFTVRRYVPLAAPKRSYANVVDTARG